MPFLDYFSKKLKFLSQAIPSICEEKHYSALYIKDAEKLRNYIYYKCGDLDLAEDIAQESFIKLWQKCKDVIFDKASSFLFTIAHRLFIDSTRKDKVVLNFAKSQVPKSNSEDPSFILETNEFKEKIEKHISDLPDGQREVFLLNRIDKLTYKEIAKTLDISETAVEKRMAKALLKLRDQIEEFKTYKI